MPYEDVFALEDSVLLLDGRFTIHLTEGPPVTLKYNGSARDTVVRLTALSRDLAGTAPELVAAELSDRATSEAIDSVLSSDLDYGLRGDCSDLLTREPSTRFVAGHASRAVAPAGGFLAAVTHRFRPALLQAGIMCETPTSMIYMHRRDQIVRGRATELSHASTVLFPDRITDVTRTPHPLYPEVEMVQVGTRTSKLELAIPSDSLHTWEPHRTAAA